MQLKFHGGAREVGRSCIEIATASKRILLDCGLKLTPEGTEYPIGFQTYDDIDAVFISHAHLDHTGALPLFDHNGMDCPIFATRTTKTLTRLLLKDAFKIGKITHQHLGYDEMDIKKALSCMQRVKIDTKGSFDSVDYEYFDAGHIPGAASVFLDVEGTTFLYTGDLNTTPTNLHAPAETDFPMIDILICESTYGDREHPPRKQEEESFINEVKATVKRGGTAIIPVFALGRSQEVLMMLAKYRWKVPIYFDGMGREASDIILSDPKSIKAPGKLKAALSNVRMVRGKKERTEAINRQCIIVTTSGMLTGGPVLHYMKYLNDPNNSLLLTGYQAEQTNGALLLEGKEIFIDGWKTRIKCNLKQFDFSAHAGLSQVKELVRKLRPKKVFFIHGEERSVDNLKEWASALGMDAYAPHLGDIIDV